MKVFLVRPTNKSYKQNGLAVTECGICLGGTGAGGSYTEVTLRRRVRGILIGKGVPEPYEFVNLLEQPAKEDPAFCALLIAEQLQGVRGYLTKRFNYPKRRRR
jgi:hypothetical protein